MKTEEIYSIFQECNYMLCTDTRKIIKNSLFVALKGDNYDANDFVDHAIRMGCLYAISDNYNGNNEKVIVVNNSLETLQKLAAYHRKQMNLKVIGITGTNGKTTTKELIAAILREKYKIIYTQGNFNNHIGVPLTLLTIKPDTEIAIIEMGANHPGEIKALCEIADPDFGIITNVGKAHLEGFGSFEGVINTKTELYRHIASKDGQIFINSENPYLWEHAKNLNCIKYGKSEDADIRVIKYTAVPALKINWLNVIENKEYTVQTNLIGEYNWENVMAAITIGTFFKVEHEKVKSALENYHPNNHRSQWIQFGTNNILMDAYNANPTSMLLAINNFASLPFKNKGVILGDMRELGMYAEEEHRNILNQLEIKGFDKVMLVGENFYHLNKNNKFNTFLHVEDLMSFIKVNPIDNMTLLIKGSHGIHLERLMEIFNESDEKKFIANS